MIDPLLENTLPRTSRPPRPRKMKAPRGLREPTTFEKWAWSPISAYRVGLTLSYFAVVYFGLSAFIAGVPAFTIAAPHGWTPVWSTVLVLAGITASIGSASSRKRFERTELVGAWVLFVTLGTYSATLLFLAYAVGDLNRAAVGAGFLALGVQPGVRLLWLMSQIGRGKSEAVDADGV